MKKILIVIVAVAVVLLLAFLLAGFFGPQGFKMERSVEINAPKSVIYKNIADYTIWVKWSPWAAIDTNCKYEYYGTQGQASAGYKWKGNSKVGEGGIHTTDMSENNSLTAQLTFLKPWASVAQAGFKLEDGANGATRVTWTFSQVFSFSQRPMMLVMNMEKMLGPDYERGLANLKAISEKQASQPNIEVKEVQWEAHTYLADRAVVSMKDLGAAFQDKLPKAFKYAVKNKLPVEEPAAAGLYYTWDTAAGTTDFAIAVRLRGPAKASGGYTVITLPASKALLVDFYGPYDKMKSAHDAIHRYAAAKGLKLNSPCIEEYVGDPGTEKDPNKVLTKVYYFIAD